ncbi:MAG: formate dehydrogenase subunit gamma [Pseudomonadota bacterium]
MTKLGAWLCAMIGLAVMLTVMPPLAEAQQINPTAESVTEDALLEALQGDQMVDGRVSIPDELSTGLIKPGNKGWADTHGGSVRLLTAVALIGILVVLVAFYMIRGRIQIDAGRSGMNILRFSAFERFAHWLMAGSFIVLALTGLNLVFGRALLLPIVGEGTFGTLSTWGKVAHNYLGWAFMLGLILSFVAWVAHNIPNKVDAAWIKQGGGLLQKGVHPPAKKFNAGQKVIFWAVMLGGAALSFTGVMLLFPALAGTQADWQLYQLIHGLVAAGLVALVVAHIYIGSIGMEGAFDAMGSGEVDVNWAKEHHSLWVEEVEGKPEYEPHASNKVQPAE